MPSPPPLNALRVFESVARHASMTAAASDLGVTPGAVSQQIALLEDRLGVALFRRHYRALEPTEAARILLPHIRAAFRQINEAVQRVKAFSSTQILTLSAPPAFAAAWLVPRLGRFQTRHPAIDLHLSTGRTLVDLDSGGIDAAIRHGLGRWRGLRADRLVSADLVPLCAPSLLPTRTPMRTPADLASMPLLHDAARQDWAAWFQAHGVSSLPDAAFTGPVLDDQLLLIRAAAAGQGVALITEALARAELAAGTLVPVLDLPQTEESAYWLVYPRARADQPAIAALRDWLREEAARDASPPAARQGAERDPAQHEDGPQAE